MTLGYIVLLDRLPCAWHKTAGFTQIEAIDVSAPVAVFQTRASANKAIRNDPDVKAGWIDRGRFKVVRIVGEPIEKECEECAAQAYALRGAF